MTLPLTKEMLSASYGYLKETPPFVKWNLPEPEEVEFKVSRRTNEFGRYQLVGGKHTISISAVAIGHTSTLMSVMSHEIIHLHLEESDMESRSGSLNTHNAAFRILAAQVCKVHGFDPKAFY